MTSARQAVWDAPITPRHPRQQLCLGSSGSTRLVGVISGMGAVVAGWSPGVYLFTGADGPDLEEARQPLLPETCFLSGQCPANQRLNPAEEAVSLPEEEIVKRGHSPRQLF